MINVWWSASKNLLKQIFGFDLTVFFFTSYFKLERKKSISTFVIAIDHDTTKNSELRLWEHPFVVNDIFDVLLHNVVHFVNQGCIHVFGFRHLISEWSQKVFDTIHLKIKISILKISFGRIVLQRSKCSNSCSTSA